MSRHKPTPEPYSEPQPDTTGLDPIIPIAPDPRPAGGAEDLHMEQMTAIIAAGMIGHNPMHVEEVAAKALAIAVAIRLGVKKLGEIPLPENPDVNPASANAPESPQPEIYTGYSEGQETSAE